MVVDNLHEEPLDISAEADWDSAYKTKIYNSDGRSLRFGNVFTNDSESKARKEKPTHANTSPRPATQLLIVFIRHFFCGNCQEYLRRLVSEPSLSPESLAERNLRVAIIGCGKFSLISSYRKLTNVPQSWQIFTDPTTELYRHLGMYRTLSLGKKSPRYIQRSLTGGMLHSVVQGMRRIPEGDVMSAGSLSVNGGEFFFSLEQEGSNRSSKAEDWTLEWCHRMQNSRDHTEVEDLLRNIGLLSKGEVVADHSLKSQHKRTQSVPLSSLKNKSDTGGKLDANLKQSDGARPGLRRSLSIRRQSWIDTAEHLVRSKSKRRSMLVQPSHSGIAETSVPIEAY